MGRIRYKGGTKGLKDNIEFNINIDNKEIFVSINQIGTMAYDNSESFGCGYMPDLCKTLKAKDDIGAIEVTTSIVPLLKEDIIAFQNILNKKGKINKDNKEDKEINDDLIKSYSIIDRFKDLKYVQALIESDSGFMKNKEHSIKLGNIYNDNWGTGLPGNVWEKNALSPTLTTMQGGGRQPMIIDEISTDKLMSISNNDIDDIDNSDNKIKEVNQDMSKSVSLENSDKGIKIVNIPQTVSVRKYDVDTKKLCEILRKGKESTGYSNIEIAGILNVPTTKVEHWFRQDSSFAIPDSELWIKLKKLLNIETDEFDLPITEFEEKEGVFEKSERHYLEDGISPTLTSVGQEKIIVSNVSHLNNNNEHIDGINIKTKVDD